MSIIACYNIKGGVGKTTTAVNLAYTSAKEGKRTLLWDLDLQSGAGFFLKARKPDLKSIKLFANGRSGMKEVIQPTEYELLDILPADFSLHKLDRYLDSTKKPKQRLAKLLKTIAKRYDHIILDCPPGYSLLTQNIFNSSTAVISPVLPNPFSIENLDVLRRRIKKNASKDLLLFPFFSMVDRRKRLHREIVELHLNGKQGFLHTLIPYASQLEKMAVERAPIAVFAGRSRAAKAYKELWGEINTNIEMYMRVKKIKMW